MITIYLPRWENIQTQVKIEPWVMCRRENSCLNHTHNVGNEWFIWGDFVGAKWDENYVSIELVEQ